MRIRTALFIFVAGLCTILPATAHAAFIHRVCMFGQPGLDGRWVDASIHDGLTQIDWGEDLGRNDGPVELMPRLLTVVKTSGGTTAFSGYTDSSGCTPFWSLPYYTSYTVTYTFFFYNGSNVAMSVTEPNDSAPSRVVTGVLHPYAPNVPVPANIFVDGADWFNATYIAAARGAEAFVIGDSASYQYRRKSTGPSQTGYHPVWGTPITELNSLAVAGSRSKFNAVHEFGHQLQLGDSVRAGLPLLESDVDFTGCGGMGNQHNYESPEFESAAMVEGFGNYVAAVAWNNPSQTAILVGDSYATLMAPSDFKQAGNADQLYANNHVGTCGPDLTNETDWLQFFWNYRTDTVTGTTLPTNEDILDELTTAHLFSGDLDYQAFHAAILSLHPSRIDRADLVGPLTDVERP